MNSTPIIVVAEEKELDRHYWIREEFLPLDKNKNFRPTFRQGEVAKFFFGRRIDWLRKKIKEAEQDGVLMLDGQPFNIRRSKGGQRVFSLAEVEYLAHALAQANAISGPFLQRTVMAVRQCAILYGVKM